MLSQVDSSKTTLADLLASPKLANHLIRLQLQI